MEQQRLSGRRGQAAQNDELILAAAREVFVADADAPISAVASFGSWPNARSWIHLRLPEINLSMNVPPWQAARKTRKLFVCAH